MKPKAFYSSLLSLLSIQDATVVFVFYYMNTYAAKEVIHGQQAPDIRYIESPQPANHLVPVATDVVHTHICCQLGEEVSYF